jgi:hypothetical protein
MKRLLDRLVSRVHPETLDMLRKMAARFILRAGAFVAYVLALWAAFNAAPMPSYLHGGHLTVAEAAGIVGLAWLSLAAGRAAVRRGRIDAQVNVRG